MDEFTNPMKPICCLGPINHRKHPGQAWSLMETEVFSVFFVGIFWGSSHICYGGVTGCLGNLGVLRYCLGIPDLTRIFVTTRWIETP